MNLFKTLLAGIAGTTSMTLFSYAVTRMRKKQFKEPVLLHRLLKRGMWPGLIKTDDQGDRSEGWLLHYATGLLFSTVYDRIWKRTKIAPSIPSGIVMGAVSGLAGIAVWDITFRIHPDPPKVDAKEFYRHLLIAHTVFGLIAALGYRLPEDMENTEEK